MSDSEKPNSGGEPEPRPRLFPRTYRKRSTTRWLIPLVVILLVIIFLPRLMDLLLPE